MVCVKFSSLEEFLSEMRFHGPGIEGKIVRATYRWHTVPGVPYRVVSFLASYVAGNQLVQLEETMGEDWGVGMQTTLETTARRQSAMRDLLVIAGECLLTVRHGSLEVR